MALSEIHEIRQEGVLFNETVLNIWHVETDLSYGASDVVTAFYDHVYNGALGPALSNDYTLTKISVISLGDVSDFSEVSVVNTGDRAEEALPSHDCVTMRFNRTSREFRHGYKRFAGVPIGDSNDGDVLPSSITTYWQPVFNAIVGAWDKNSAPGVTVCRYVVIKRVKLPDPNNPGEYIYKLPETDAQLSYYQPTSGAVLPQIKSQVTRRR